MVVFVNEVKYEEQLKSTPQKRVYHKSKGIFRGNEKGIKVYSLRENTFLL